MLIINWRTINVWGTALYSYICQMVVMPVISELKNPTERRCKQCFNRATVIEIIVYLTIAGCGYLSFGSNTPPTVTDREPLTKGDYAMKVAESFLFVTLSMGIPIRANACRRVILASIEAIGGKDNFFTYLFSTLFMLIIPSIISICFEQIQVIFSILGGSLGTMIMVLWPGSPIFRFFSFSPVDCFPLSRTHVLKRTIHYEEKPKGSSFGQEEWIRGIESEIRKDPRL